ncbi:MAG: tyrosine-type recombinase/integrase [Bifidobacteriaceae bacterium]|jgi:integrase|nr:tyrosine-type recombinase/integrase [Bifidobacteriaceae bacterium]
MASAYYRDESGKRRLMERRDPGKGKAAAKLREALLAMRAQADGQLAPSTTLARLGTSWLDLEIRPSPRLAKSTVERYEYVVNRVIAPAIGAQEIREFTTGRADGFLQAYAKRSGAESAKLARTCLTGMMGLAVRHGAAAVNPLRETTKLHSDTPEPRALTLEQVRELRAQLRSDAKAARWDLPDVVDLMIATGCRTGEALAVRWEDVDLDAGTVAITGKIARHRGTGLVRENFTKGHKHSRKQLAPWAVAMLLRRRVDSLPGGEWDLVFPSLNGTPREVRTVDRQWQKHRERHPEWAWVTPKVFRKTTATLVGRKLGVEAARGQLDHSSASTTLKHYYQPPELGPDTRGVLAELANESEG